jgi:cation transport regulator ChaC
MIQTSEVPMSKVRTTIALTQTAHQWLKARTGSLGEMTEYLESLIQKERTLGPLEARMQRQADRLEQIVSGLDTSGAN